jgi:PAS domain S-box-containing protein
LSREQPLSRTAWKVTSPFRLRGPLANDSTARMLQVLLVFLAIWCPTAVLATWNLAPVSFAQFFNPAILEGSLIVALVLLRLGYVRSASLVHLWGIWIWGTLTFVFFGGIRSPGTVLFVTLPISAAWLLGYRAALWTAAGCLSTALVFTVLEATGAGLPYQLRATALGSWAILVQATLIGAIPVGQVITRLLATLAERQRAEEDLRKKDHLLSESQRVAHIGSWSFDPAAQSLLWSDETYAIFGVSPDMFTPSVESVIGLIHPDDRLAMREWIGATVAGHSAGLPEFRAVRRDGSIHILSGQGEMVFSIDTNTSVMVGTVQDITERKRADEALKKINLLNRLELAVGEVFASETSLPAALQECCAVVVRILDGAFARIWTLNQDGAVLDLQASAGLYTHIDGSHRQVPVGQYKIGRIAAERQPLLTNNVTGDPSIHDQDWAKKEGLVAFAGYPLLVEDRLLGVIAMFSRHPLPDVALRGLALVAGRIAVNIEHNRAEIEQENLQAQLAQSQKMESVGRLAGGIAHDFSNLMSAILLHHDLAVEELRSGDPLIEPLTEIRKAAERAVALTQQLMAFGRKRVLQAEVLDLNLVILECEKLLRPMIREDIQLVLTPGPGLGLMKADRGQLDQLIMNLVVNSRDAMPHGGTLTIETANVELEEADASANPEARQGPYVRLVVRDTGVGMDQKTQAQIFEPFFTTKEVGKGTGLGLSMVYGIVKQNGGYVTVHSEEGHGTEFKIYLPRVPETPEPIVPPKVAPGERGTERILVVEDEPALWEPVRRLLEGAGYQVLVSKDVDEAIQIAMQHNGSLDLLLTDVVMPNMSGPQLAGYLRPFYPQMKVLYMSGYPEPRQPDSPLASEVDYIQKPFSKQQLLGRLREVLEGGNRSI